MQGISGKPLLSALNLTPPARQTLLGNSHNDDTLQPPTLLLIIGLQQPLLHSAYTMLEEQRISTAAAAAAVAAAEVPTSSAVLPSSSPLSNVAPPPPMAAAAATAPSSSTGNDSTPLQVAAKISECDGATDHADDPHATASCPSNSDDGIADVDTAVAAASSSSSSSSPQKQSSLSPSQRSRRITTNYHQDYSSDNTIPSPDHQQDSRMVEDCATSAEAAPSSQSWRDRSSRTSSSSSSSNSSISNTNATTITQGKTLNKTDCNIVLSMKDPTYKATMFSFFQKLGVKTSDKRNVERETQVKNEAYDFFKNSGGRLMTYINFRRPDEGVVEVDEKTARDSK